MNVGGQSAVAPGTLRQRVRELLKERPRADQRSASWLMRAAGISWSTAQALAAGKQLNLESKTIIKLCDALGVTPDELLLYEPEEGE